MRVPVAALVNVCWMGESLAVLLDFQSCRSYVPRIEDSAGVAFDMAYAAWEVYSSPGRYSPAFIATNLQLGDGPVSEPASRYRSFHYHKENVNGESIPIKRWGSGMKLPFVSNDAVQKRVLAFCDCRRFTPAQLRRGGTWLDPDTLDIWTNLDKFLACDQPVSNSTRFSPVTVLRGRRIDTIQWNPSYLAHMEGGGRPEFFPLELLPGQPTGDWIQQNHIDDSDLQEPLATAWLRALLMTGGSYESTANLQPYPPYIVNTWVWGEATALLRQNGQSLIRPWNNAPHLALAARAAYLINKYGWFLDGNKLLPPLPANYELPPPENNPLLPPPPEYSEAPPPPYQTPQ